MVGAALEPGPEALVLHPVAGAGHAGTVESAQGGAVRDRRRDDWLTPDGQSVDHPTHVLAHLSDTHLTSAGIRYNGVIDADAALERLTVPAAMISREAAARASHLDRVRRPGLAI